MQLGICWLCSRDIFSFSCWDSSLLNYSLCKRWGKIIRNPALSQGILEGWSTSVYIFCLWTSQGRSLISENRMTDKWMSMERRNLIQISIFVISSLGLIEINENFIFSLLYLDIHRSKEMPSEKVFNRKTYVCIYLWYKRYINSFLYMCVYIFSIVWQGSQIPQISKLSVRSQPTGKKS